MKRFWLITFFMFFIANLSYSQQFTMKGGILYSQLAIPKNENPAGSVDGMVNYYYEANYARRFARYRYWTIGFGYLGSGGIIHAKNPALGFNASTPDAEEGVYYQVNVRFNNFIIPIKFKFSTEHIKHPRYYGYIGVAPGWLFNEERSLDYHYYDEDLERVNQNNPKALKNLRNTLFPYHPQKLQGYVMLGGGIYYKHIILDVAVMANTFNAYKEFLAPVSFTYGVIASIGVQISGPFNKYSCKSFSI